MDLIYFDRDDVSRERDRELEARLHASFDAPWSVKNQARMHERNAGKAYHSSRHAMSFWPENSLFLKKQLHRNGSGPEQSWFWRPIACECDSIHHTKSVTKKICDFRADIGGNLREVYC